jgi:hypothetical protein
MKGDRAMRAAPCAKCLALEADPSHQQEHLSAATLSLGLFHAEVDPNALHEGWRCDICQRLWKFHLDGYVDRAGRS